MRGSHGGRCAAAFNSVFTRTFLRQWQVRSFHPAHVRPDIRKTGQSRGKYVLALPWRGLLPPGLSPPALAIHYYRVQWSWSSQEGEQRLESSQSVSVERDISASPERVWRLLTNLESWPNTFGSIVSLTRVEGGPEFDEGTRWRETRRILRREGTEELLVTSIEPGRSFTAEAENRGMIYASTFTIDPAGDGSRLTIEFAGRAAKRQGPVGRLFAKLGINAVRKGLEQDAADIARAAER